MNKHYQRLAGVDEAGRGPLAGPVIAAAVILDSKRPILGLADSKKLSPVRREELSLEIQACAMAWAIGRAEVWEIDQINILQASLLAMSRAVEGLSIKPDFVQVDGNRCPKISYPVEAIIKGDAKVAEISAASILAKVARDAEMVELHAAYPLYQFDQHKGYPTVLHRQLLEKYGCCPHHRRSYAPVKAQLAMFAKVAHELESQ